MRALLTFALFAATAVGCSSLLHGNDVQFAERSTTIAYCESRGEVEASVRKSDPKRGKSLLGAPINMSDQAAVQDALGDEARAVGADTVYDVKMEEGANDVTGRGMAYFCDRANKPHDYE